MPQSRSRQTTSKSERQRAAVHRRQELQRAHEEAERRAVRRHRRKRRMVALACALVVAVPGGIVVWKQVTAPDPPPQLRAALVTRDGATLAITSAPSAFGIRYRIETYPTSEADGGGKGPAVTTEDVMVRRPFDGRIVEREGEPPGERLQLDLRSVLGRRGDYTRPTEVQSSKDAPAAAVGDVRLDATLGALVDAGFLLPRERRRALGRECQVYRTGLPLESLSVSAPTEDSYADACVDASGLILEELAVSGGTLSSRVTAVEVDDRAAFSAETFAIEGPTGVGAGGVELDRVDAGATLSTKLWVFTQPPAGFEGNGRFLLTAPDGAGAPQPRYVDVFTRGPDFLVIEQGVLSAEPDPPVLPGTDVDLGPLGSATVVPLLTGNTLTAHPGEDWFVKVVTTLERGALREALSGLRNG